VLRTTEVERIKVFGFATKIFLLINLQNEAILNIKTSLNQDKNW
jgi:hypothetical protein